jgi:hypothetical protein
MQPFCKRGATGLAQGFPPQNPHVQRSTDTHAIILSSVVVVGVQTPLRIDQHRQYRYDPGDVSTPLYNSLSHLRPVLRVPAGSMPG